MRPLRLAKDRRNVNEKYAQSTGTINPKLPKLPLAFIGLAAYRAWIELTFVGSYFREAPYSPMARDAFDLSMMAFLVLGVLFAKRLTPLIEKQSIRNTALFMLLVSTTCVVGGASFAEWGAVLSLAGAIIGGAGIAITLILWSELYSCLNPLRVALYYSASIVASALIVYTMKGFLFPWFATYLFILPIATIASAGAAFRSIPQAERSHISQAQIAFPWKLVLWMAIFSLAYGLVQEQLTTSAFGPHSSPGALFVGLFVFMGIALRKRKFDFSAIYRVALPLMVGAFLIIPIVGNFNNMVTAFFVSGAYTACSILVMIIMSNMCYRYGIAAMWLFGIERTVRMAFNGAGRTAHDVLLNAPSGFDMPYVLPAIVIILAVVSTMVLLSESGLANTWGMNVSDTEPHRMEQFVRSDVIKNHSHDLALQFGLTLREEEILSALAERKHNPEIAKELFISEQTVKTHVRNLYRKLDIHSRDELFSLFDGIGGK